LFANPASVATSTEYVAVAALVRTAFVIVNVTGCSLNLKLDPVAGWAARGDVKLTVGALGLFEHAGNSSAAAPSIEAVKTSLFIDYTFPKTPIPPPYGSQS
jgi:hypothetical protein